MRSGGGRDDWALETARPTPLGRTRGTCGARTCTVRRGSLTVTLVREFSSAAGLDAAALAAVFDGAAVRLEVVGRELRPDGLVAALRRVGEGAVFVCAISGSPWCPRMGLSTVTRVGLDVRGRRSFDVGPCVGGAARWIRPCRTSMWCGSRFIGKRRYQRRYMPDILGHV
ncbi:hypothetical protein GCM10009780_51990 [Actinomadura alba]